MPTELQLIARVRRALEKSGASSSLSGIGDDAALLRAQSHTDLAVSCDAFLEDAHFRIATHPPETIGYKALARAASDLAAMGATPKFFLLSLSLPNSRTGQWLDKFLAGMSRAARSLGMQLAGGDTSRHSAVAAVVTVIGLCARGRAVRRDGARHGDQIFVSGRLGSAQLGLQLILSGEGKKARWKKLLDRHLRPEPRIALGRWLATRGLASAMIDTSDGLSRDLANLCRASGTGARVWAARIPAVQVPPALAARRGFEPLALALHGGEDYELLFTVPPKLAKKIPRAYRGVPLTRIGEITRHEKLVLISEIGRPARLEPRGWDHFQKITGRKRRPDR